MVVGEYSILSAIRRIETCSYPSVTNSSLAASRISCRRNFFCRALRSRTPMGPFLTALSILSQPAGVNPRCFPCPLVPHGYRLHLEVSAAQQRTRSDKRPRWKIFGEICLVGGVELVVVSQVAAENLYIHQVVHRHVSLSQRGFVSVQQQLDLLLDFLRRFARFRIQPNAACEVQRVARQNGVTVGSLHRFVRQIDGPALRRGICLRECATHGNKNRQRERYRQDRNSTIHDDPPQTTSYAVRCCASLLRHASKGKQKTKPPNVGRPASPPLARSSI